MSLLAISLQLPILLAEREAYSVSVGLVMLCAILGLLVTLRPANRTSEVKRKHHN